MGGWDLETPQLWRPLAGPEQFEDAAADACARPMLAVRLGIRDEQEQASRLLHSRMWMAVYWKQGSSGSLKNICKTIRIRITTAIMTVSDPQI